MLDLISRIDEDIVDRTLNKRHALWRGVAKRRRKLFTSIVAVAASILLIVSAVFVVLPYLGKQVPVFGKQVPVYTGMTVSNNAPAIQEKSLLSESETEKQLFNVHYTKGTLSRSLNSFVGVGGVRDGVQKSLENSDNSADISASTGSYYAQKNEDIYIYVHLSNPDAFEILSFTLNGVKYSSYMFEEGSDLETLVLKYNVGDVEGVHQYTIDAIKYVDGKEIKDVIMEGDTTIEVIVGTTDKSISFNERFEGWDLVIDPVWSESFAGEKKLLSLAIYDGEKLVRELDTDTKVIEGLPMDSKLLLVATYVENGKTVTKKSVIQTPKQSEGLAVTGGIVTGIGSCTDTELYINMPVGELAFAENKYISKVYFGDRVTSIGENAFLVCTSLEEISFSEGIEKIGVGSFAECRALKTVSLPQSLTDIGAAAFSSCSSLEQIVLPSGVSSVGSGAFAGCDSLEEIVLPSGVSSVGSSVFEGCEKLRAVYIKNALIKIKPGYPQMYDAATQSYIPTPVGTLFDECPLLSDVYFDGTLEQWKVATSELVGWYNLKNDITVHCTDGDVVISNMIT